MKKMLLLFLLTSFNAMAARSVSIVSSEGKIELINSSAVSVNYSMECYDKVSGSVLSGVGGTNLTLNSKASNTVAAGVNCTSGSPSHTSTTGFIACPGSVTFANAGTLCGTGSHLCTFDNLTSQSANLSAASNYWLTPGQDAWYKISYGTPTARSISTPETIDKGKKKGTKTIYHYPKSYSKSDNSCSKTNTGGINYCSESYQFSQSDVSSGSLCCSDNNGFKSCKVTINNATATGHLQSPQYKGGAPF